MSHRRASRFAKEASEIKGRIIRGVGGSYYVACAGDIYKCAAKGIFRNKGLTPMVGDYVDFEITHAPDYEGSIVQIHRRINMLERPKVANIDQAVFVVALKSPSLNLDMLDKFLVLAEKQEIDAMIALNKIDLSETGESEALSKLYKDIGYRVVSVSAASGIGLEELLDEMKGKVSVMAGASGVGKSSLVNSLAPGIDLQTGLLSQRIERGRHTTRHAQLIEVGIDTFIVDSPGFSNLEALNLKPGELSIFFREFSRAGQCHFRNCLHLEEPGCAVRQAIGLCISQERYQRYKNILQRLGG